MGTRSLTYVHECGLKSTPLVCMYRQMDGYPEGHGKELQEFLKTFTIVNGIGVNSYSGKTANGMSCLAAQLVAHFKTEIGSFYLYPTDSGNTEAYNYHVYLNENNKLALKYFTFSDSKAFPLPLGKTEPEYEKVAEFVYTSAYAGAETKWRKIGFVELTKKNYSGEQFLTGYDLNDEDKFKKFRLSAILDGKIYYTNVTGEDLL